MPVTVKVNGVANSLVHKGSNGISMATIPDVCKTPSPGGPIPIPYPNISQSATLDKGTTTVKADGMMIATKGSEFSLSNGDNAGVAGGVKSSTFMKESTWILYSFDVKMDGNNACRLSDKKFQNHENTVDLGGTLQVPTVVLFGTSQEDLENLADECNKKTNDANGKCPAGPKGQDCTTLGTAKHKCCENAIKEHNKKNPGAKPALASEQGFAKDGTPLTEQMTANARSQANTAYSQAMQSRLASYPSSMPAGLAVSTARRALRAAGTWWSAYKSAGGAHFIADVLVHEPPPPATKTNTKKAFDFKFNCADEGHMSTRQMENYESYTGKTPEVIHKDGRKC